VKYVKNGKKYYVGPMGFTSDDLERLKVEGHKRAGDGDRHVGIYASPDNWRTCVFNTFMGVHVHT